MSSLLLDKIRSTDAFNITVLLTKSNNLQKQPPREVLNKRCSKNMQQSYGRTPMPKCDFNKVAKQLYWNHTSHECSPINLLYIFRTPFAKNTYGYLLLNLSAWRRSSTKLASQIIQQSLFIVETVFMRIDLSFVKFGKWSK